MKGIVFKEMLEMVGKTFGDNTLEEMIEQSSLPSEGAYTSVGTYDHEEIISMVGTLHKITGLGKGIIIRKFGVHLAKAFVRLYPKYFNTADTFAFLVTVDTLIHMEVKRLYPDAELPKFKYQFVNKKTLAMTYTSTRPFADLAEGLIQGVINHYGEKIELTSEDTSGGENTSRIFIITKE